MATLVDMPFMGTSNYEYFGPGSRIFAMIRDGRRDEGDGRLLEAVPGPAGLRRSDGRVAGSNFLHRMLWKYQGWLQGFNGGPLRAPTMRLVDRQMKALRQGLVAAGFDVDAPDDAEFFRGRNPA